MYNFDAKSIDLLNGRIWGYLYLPKDNSNVNNKDNATPVTGAAPSGISRDDQINNIIKSVEDLMLSQETDPKKKQALQDKLNSLDKNAKIFLGSVNLTGTEDQQLFQGTVALALFFSITKRFPGQDIKITANFVTGHDGKPELQYKVVNNTTKKVFNRTIQGTSLENLSQHRAAKMYEKINLLADSWMEDMDQDGDVASEESESMPPEYTNMLFFSSPQPIMIDMVNVPELVMKGIETLEEKEKAIYNDSQKILEKKLADRRVDNKLVENKQNDAIAEKNHLEQKVEAISPDVNDVNKLKIVQDNLRSLT